MKKNKIILSLFVLLITSFSLFSQKMEDEFLTGEYDFGDILPPLSPPCDCSAYGNFTFVNSFYALETALINQALLKKAKEDEEDKWIEKQQGIIKSELEKKFGKSFANFDEAKNELFRHSELNNISKNSVAPRNEFSSLKHNGFIKRDKYLEDIKILELRGIEIKAGNIHNPKYGYLEVDGIQMKNITNIEALNIKWDNIYGKFSTNYGTTYFNNQVHHYLNNLGQGLTDLILSLKNEYYEDFDKWDRLDYIQFLINYEYYKKLNPLYHSQELLRLFNKFKDTDKGTSTVIKNYAMGRSTYPSIFKGDSGLSKEIYELLQNPADYNEASILARKEADRLRIDGNALDGLLNGVSTSDFAINNLIAEIGNLNDGQKNWLFGHRNEAGKIIDYLTLYRVNGYVNLDKKSFSKDVIDILRDVKNISSLNTAIKNEDFIKIIGHSLQARNQNLYSELNSVFADYNSSSLLSLNEMQIASQKAKEIYNIAGKVYNLNFTDINQFSTFERRVIVENSLFLSILPQISSIGQYWPKNAEEWAVVGNLFEQFLPDLLLGFIPGSSIIDVIKGFNSGDTVAIALGIAGVLVDAFGGSIFRGLAKAGKITYKVFKSFKTLYKFIKIVKNALAKGYKLVLEGDIVKFFRKSDNVHIASSLSNLLTLKFPVFGGDIVSHHSKTTTLLGKYLENKPNGTYALIKSGLTESITGVTSKTTFNVLNDPNFSGWITNKTWLNDAISRGDIFRAISNPKDIRNVFDNIGGIDPTKFSNINTLKDYLIKLTSDEINQLSYYGREIRHLFQNGYTFDSLTNQFIK